MHFEDLFYFILFYFILFYFILFLRWNFALVAQAGVQWRDLSSPQPLPGSSDPPASAPSSWDYRCVPPSTGLIFVFLVETGFYHVGQAGLELQTSIDLSALASQCAGITGMSHCTWPDFVSLVISLALRAMPE